MLAGSSTLVGRAVARGAIGAGGAGASAASLAQKKQQAAHPMARFARRHLGFVAAGAGAGAAGAAVAAASRAASRGGRGGSGGALSRWLAAAGSQLHAANNHNGNGKQARNSRRMQPLAAFMSTEAAAPPEAAVAPPVEKFRRDYAPLPWKVNSVDLRFSLNDGAADDERATTVTSKVVLAPAGKKGGGADIVLDCEDIELESVAINGEAVEGYTLAGDVLTIPAAAVPDGAATFTLETVSLLAPAANLQLSGLYKSSGMFCTQCEAEGFRRITPYFDRPDVMTTYTVRIEADKKSYPVLVMRE